jgi:hypothetical protein
MRTVSLTVGLLLAAGNALAKNSAAIERSKCAGCPGAQRRQQDWAEIGGYVPERRRHRGYAGGERTAPPPHVKAFQGANEATAKTVAA